MLMFNEEIFFTCFYIILLPLLPIAIFITCSKAEPSKTRNAQSRQSRRKTNVAAGPSKQLVEIKHTISHKLNSKGSTSDDQKKLNLKQEEEEAGNIKTAEPISKTGETVGPTKTHETTTTTNTKLEAIVTLEPSKNVITEDKHSTTEENTKNILQSKTVDQKQKRKTIDTTAAPKKSNYTKSPDAFSDFEHTNISKSGYNSHGQEHQQQTKDDKSSGFSILKKSV
uniref:Uncharacterized protein n=1 Tax=Panagrolaimus sp. PS1159 TaxID=55785 RepID=A0AC35FKX2_9BILA